jgi:hypothetical protein
MSDVSITFDGDMTKLNRQIQQMANEGKKAAKDIKEPFDKILEADKKVERSMSNIAKSIASAATPSQALAQVFDGIEGIFDTSLAVGGAVAVGMALNQALNDAAKGADRYFDQVAKSIGKPFEATQSNIDRMNASIEEMAGDIADDGLFERLIFGNQKEELLESEAKALEMAKQIVALKKEAESGHAVDMGFRRNRVAAMKAVEDDGTIEGGERSKRAKEEAQQLELQIKQVEELQAAEERLKAVQMDRTATDITRQNQKALYDQVVERHKAERDALNEQILGARERRDLEQDLYMQSQRHAMEQLGFMSEREKLELALEQSGERLDMLADSRAAKETEINAALLDQAKIKQQLEAFEKAEVDASANISRLLLERKQIGKSDLDQQRFRLTLLQSEADALEMNLDGNKNKEALERKLNEIAEERLALKEAERMEEEKLRDIAHQRIQMAENDPYIRAKNEAQWAQEEAERVEARPDASESEKAAARLKAAQATRGFIDAAVSAGPSLGDVANSDPTSIRNLRRSANRGGLDRASQARQAQARYALADAQYARDPYGAGRDRSERTRRQAQIQEDQATGNLDRRLSADEAERLREMSPQEYNNERRKRIAEREEASRERQRSKERDQWERENPIDAKKKREGKKYDKSKEPGSPGHEGEHGPESEMPGSGKDGQNVSPAAAALGRIEAILGRVEPKIPMNILG